MVTILDDVLTIDLTSDFSGGVLYYVSIDSGFVKDHAGNPFTGISSNQYWNFLTTDIDNAPIVT
jgi:hypothetical protein